MEVGGKTSVAFGWRPSKFKNAKHASVDATSSPFMTAKL
jgi:hypothetical protein